MINEKEHIVGEDSLLSLLFIDLRKKCIIYLKPLFVCTFHLSLVKFNFLIDNVGGLGTLRVRGSFENRYGFQCSRTPPSPPPHSPILLTLFTCPVCFIPFHVKALCEAMVGNGDILLC